MLQNDIKTVKNNPYYVIIMWFHPISITENNVIDIIASWTVIIPVARKIPGTKEVPNKYLLKE